MAYNKTVLLPGLEAGCVEWERRESNGKRGHVGRKQAPAGDLSITKLDFFEIWYRVT